MFKKLARFLARWARQVEKLVRCLACWHVKLKHWHALWPVGTFFGTLASKNENLARFWHVSTQARWQVNHAGAQARWQVNHTGTQARWHVDHVGMQTRMACDLANSIKVNNSTISSGGGRNPKKILEPGICSSGSMTLIILKKEMYDSMKTIKSIKDSGPLLKVSSKQLKMKKTEQRGRYLSFLLGTLSGRLLGKLLLCRKHMDCWWGNQSWYWRKERKDF